MSIKQTFKRIQAWWAKPALEASIKWLIENHWEWPVRGDISNHVVNGDLSIIIDRMVSKDGIAKVLLYGKPVFQMEFYYSPYGDTVYEVARYNYGAWVEDILRLYLKEKRKIEMSEKITISALFEPLDEE